MRLLNLPREWCKLKHNNNTKSSKWEKGEISLRDYYRNKEEQCVVFIILLNGNSKRQTYQVMCKTKLFGEWIHFQGRQLYRNSFCFPSEKESTLKGKNLPLGGKFFPFRVDSFSEGAWFEGKQTGKKVVSLVKMVENPSNVSGPLKKKSHVNYTVPQLASKCLPPLCCMPFFSSLSCLSTHLSYSQSLHWDYFLA